MSLVLRLVKNSKLTAEEFDGNFTFLQGLINSITAKNTILSGTTVPAVGLGQNGDYYIRTTTFEIYGPKISGVWGAATSMIGGNVDTKSSTLYVSTTGDNATAVKGVINKPYQTISAAITAASAGDLVMVYAGDYTAAGKIAMKNGVNLLFYQGAKIRGINCTAGAVASIEGWAEVVSNLGTPDETNAAIYVDGSGSKLVMRCRSLACSGTAIGFYVGNGGQLNFEAEDNITHTGATYTIVQQYASTGNGTYCRIVAENIRATASSTNMFCNFANSDASCRSFQHIKARVVSSANGANFAISHAGATGTLGQLITLVEVNYNIANNGLVFNTNSRNDSTNLNMLLHIVGGMHVGKLANVMRQGFSTGRMASVKILGASFVCDWNNATAVCIRYENANGNNGQTLLANSTFVSTFGTNTMSASNASAGAIIGINTNGANKVVDTNTTITGVALTVSAAIIDSTIQIPII